MIKIVHEILLDIKCSFVNNHSFKSYCRCSSAFFEEERAALHNKRHKIRLLQQRKISEVMTHEDLPEEIPLHLVIGTKVTGNKLSTLNFSLQS